MAKRPESGERDDWRRSIENGPAIGMRDDGTLNAFPLSELKERLAARAAEESISLDEMVRRMREDQDFEIEMLEGAARDPEAE